MACSRSCWNVVSPARTLGEGRDRQGQARGPPHPYFQQIWFKPPRWSSSWVMVARGLAGLPEFPFCKAGPAHLGGSTILSIQPYYLINSPHRSSCLPFRAEPREGRGVARLCLKPQEGLGRLGCKGQIGVHQESKAEGCFKTSCLTALPRRGDRSGQPLLTLPPMEHSPVLGWVVLDLCPKSQMIPGPLREAGRRGPEAQSYRARARARASWAQWWRWDLSPFPAQSPLSSQGLKLQTVLWFYCRPNTPWPCVRAQNHPVVSKDHLSLWVSVYPHG